MKKVSYIIALLALIILPIKVSASSSLEYTVSEPDANGVYTVEISEKITSGDIIPAEGFTFSIVGQHNLIQTINGTSDWIIDTANTTSGTNLKAATVTVLPTAGTYTGTGSSVKVFTFTYIHDPSYTGDEENKLSITPAGGTEVAITEKTTKNAKTGNFISYVGIAIGVVLIGAAYIISKKSTKLYKM
ncbi:MAG: hypothetical protein IKX00_01430 [Bacilli bacterium]|nr:hypothetical protein [Bacilli bacterium]